MPPTDALVNQHYGTGNILDQIETALQTLGKDLGALTVDDLAPIDEFHTRGRESTVEIAELAGLTPADRVLDVGCGLGGTARFLAEQYQCRVHGIDLTAEYIQVGNRLTQLVGLDDKVQLDQASALELPHENDQFDVVWTEHVQMNIANKAGFYAEIARVLKPGSRFLFHDVLRGTGSAPCYPAPWAENESISALATETEIQQTLEASGLQVEQWRNKDEESIQFFHNVHSKILEEGPPPLGIHLLMGNTAREKLQNYLTNLTENRVTVIMGLASKR